MGQRAQGESPFQFDSTILTTTILKVLFDLVEGERETDPVKILQEKRPCSCGTKRGDTVRKLVGYFRSQRGRDDFVE